MSFCPLASAPAGLAQTAASSSLPATPPTSTSAQIAPLAASFAGSTPARAQRAEVTFSNGLLDVRANNSSLNGILRDISRVTGMKVTGGVAEQRVFGNYGPAQPATVLATLLDGTGSNMLLRESTGAVPTELILTPRMGGPSPPAPPSDDEGDATGTQANINNIGPSNLAPGTQSQGFPGRSGPAGISGSGPRTLNDLGNTVNSNQGTLVPNPSTPVSAPNPGTSSISVDALPTPVTPGVSGINDVSNATNQGNVIPSATGTSGNSSDPKTPEQVYQMLEQLRQKSQQQNANPQ